MSHITITDDDIHRRPRLDGRTRVGLAAMALAVFVIANDFTSLSVALPQIERTFRTDVSTAQWVMNAYSLVFGVLIVTGGRLSDMLGRRRVFFAGMAIFAAFSVPAALAPSSAVLIGSRAVMGVGAALIWPAVISLIFGLLPSARAGLAGAIVLGTAGIGNALGPMVGGLLTDALSWRWILALNVPIAAIAIATVAAHVASDATSAPGERLDWIGVATLSIGLVALLVALDQASDWGWGSTRIVVLLVLAAAGMGAFVASQRRGRSDRGAEPLVPRDAIGRRAFAAACVTMALVSGIWFTALLYVPQFTEKVLGFSALGSGIALLPLLLVFSACAFAAGPLYNAVGARIPLICSAAGFPLGGFLLSLVGVGSPYLAMVPGLIVLGIAVGFFNSTDTTAALSALDAARTGIGSGLVFMFQLVSGALGIAIATAVFMARSDGGSSHAQFVAGFHGALRVMAAIAIAGAVSAWFVVRRPHAGSP